MDCENIAFKVEKSVENAHQISNNSFSLKFDSFSSNVSDQQRNESVLPFKPEHVATKSQNSYPQYLNNYSTMIPRNNSDPFDSCLKGVNSCELNVKFLPGNDSETFADSPIYSRIVPTFQRLAGLPITKINMRKQVRNGFKKIQKKSSSQTEKTHSRKLISKRSFKNVQEKPLICSICGAKYSYEIPFTRHISKHTDSFQCNLCPRAFSTQRSLSIHLRAHQRTRGKQVHRLSQRTQK